MDDAEPYFKRYPTVSCLIGCAVMGAIFLLVAIPVGYYMLMMYLQAISNA
jgi:hypothetical protein